MKKYKGFVPCLTGTIGMIGRVYFVLLLQPFTGSTDFQLLSAWANRTISKVTRFEKCPTLRQITAMSQWTHSTHRLSVCFLSFIGCRR